MSNTTKATRNHGIVVSSVKRDGNVYAALREITGLNTATPANIVKSIVSVFATSADVEFDRLRIVQAFDADGIKGARGMAAAAAKLNGGVTVRGFSKSTVQRYVALNAAITRDDLPALTDAQRIAAVGHVATLANYGITGDKLTAVLDSAIKASKTGAAFVRELGTVVKATGAAEYKALTAPASGNRPVKGNAGNGGKTPAVTPPVAPVTPEQTPEQSDAGDGDDTPEQSDGDAPTVPAPQGNVPRPTGQGLALMGISTARLLTELQRRAEAPGFTPEEGELFDALAAYVEERAVVDADADVRVDVDDVDVDGGLSIHADARNVAA